MSKIIDNTPGSADYGKPIIEFTYNGKQLTKAVRGSVTHLFLYDGNGKLTGTSITQTSQNNNGVIKSVITTSGSDITNIKLLKAGDVLSAEHQITYQNGNVTKWFNPNSVEILYQYDGNGNNTTLNIAEYSGGKPNGFTYLTTNKSFDDKNNFTKAMPYWIYFRTYHQNEFIGFVPGNHNPVTFNEGGSDKVYNYTYNSNGYPVSRTYIGSRTTESYFYEYIEVK
ncbi:hypothetical protein ACFQZS_14075 [Mucilaginibacter calamicampi]|uniref:YD repeat-containing protein n=1 Tax=Mucilaginibacter calamicampi TaxID=1302352 RepID=A0ABW2YZJ0_9SPHI